MYRPKHHRMEQLGKSGEEGWRNLDPQTLQLRAFPFTSSLGVHIFGKPLPPYLVNAAYSAI